MSDYLADYYAARKEQEVAILEQEVQKNNISNAENKNVKVEYNSITSTYNFSNDKNNWYWKIPDREEYYDIPTKTTTQASQGIPHFTIVNDGDWNKGKLKSFHYTLVINTGVQHIYFKITDGEVYLDETKNNNEWKNKPSDEQKKLNNCQSNALDLAKKFKDKLANIF